MKTAVGFLGVVLLGMLLVASARAQPAVGTMPEEPEAQALLDKAVEASEAGNPEQARLTYQLFLATYPQSSLRDRAYFGLAQISRQRPDDAAAIVYYQKLLREHPDSPLIEQTRQELIEAHIGLGQYDQAIPILEQERNRSPAVAFRQALTDRLVDLHLRKKDRVQAAVELLKKEWSGEDEKLAMENRLQEILDQSTHPELHELIRRFPKSYPGDAALLKSADRYEATGEYFEAEREWRRFLSTYPKSRASASVRSKILSLRQTSLGYRHRIGALLPLSGRLKPFGQQALNGIRSAVDDAIGALPEKFVGIVVRDTEAEPDGLLNGLDELVRDDRVNAVVGPLLSRQVAAAAPKADSYRMPLVTPSASDEFTQAWKYVLRNAVTRRQQGREIADYAVNTLHLKRFCILYPNDEYGAEMMKVFSEEVARREGEIIAQTAYDPKSTDFGSQIRYLKEADLSKYGLLGPPPEHKDAVREYQPGFDAVFLPGDYDQVGLIAAQLAFYDIQGVALLGTSGWHAQDLIRIGGKYIEGGIFVDGFFPESADPAVRAFVDRYRNRYGEDPSLLSAQAYDSTVMILRALQQGAATGEALRDFVERIQNFSGVTGPIRFTPEGEAVRRLYVIQVKDGKFIQIN